MTSIAQATVAHACVPVEIVESLLREHLGNQMAFITEYASEPLAHEGTNDSTSLFRVTFSWRLAYASFGLQTATWIMKRWQAGGARDGQMGITQPSELLAWEQGWLRPGALPAGVRVPFIGAWRAPDGAETWLAMADVSADLSAYVRMSLSGEQAISRTLAILAQLARFHAAWEQPERQALLETAPWLQRPEAYLWQMAPTYAEALGWPAVADMPSLASGPAAWDGLADDVHTFLDSRPAAERRLWERLLIDRGALAEGLAAYPPTLLHNDLDDRNIGLRWRGGMAATMDAPGEPELVLIDWEWLALGPAAIDVANIVQRLPVMIQLSATVPDVVWSDVFADGYYEAYRAAGGRCLDAGAWRRSFGLALVAQGVTQMPFLHGSMRRAIRGERPLPQVVGVPEAVIREHLASGLPRMEKMEERVIAEARRWL